MRPVQAVSTTPAASQCASSPANSATSLPGASFRCRSAPSQLAVRRGSITTTRVPRATRAACSRWCSTGWHQARLLPTSTTRSACSRSSYTPGTTSAPNARTCPATELAMHSREFVSMLAVPTKPFMSLLAT